MAKPQGAILANRIDDKTLKIPLAISFSDSPHYRILPLQVRVLSFAQDYSPAVPTAPAIHPLSKLRVFPIKNHGRNP